MKYALNINIICNTQSVLDAVLAKMPAIDDPRVDSEVYTPVVQTTDNESGNEEINGQIIFLLEADRDAVDADIQDTIGIISGCEVSTKVKQLDTTHFKDGKHISALGPCDPTVIYEVVP